MVHELSVRLNGIEVGTLSLINGKMEFAYNEKCKYPLSLSLPLSKEPYKEKVCRAYFGGLLPENPNMRDLLAKKYNIGIIKTSARRIGKFSRKISTYRPKLLNQS